MASIFFMTLAALIGAVGQMLMKHAAVLLDRGTAMIVPVAIMAAAFLLYGVVMLLFLQGLKFGRELSTTYPVYSLTFPFAAILAMLFYGEVMGGLQWVGIVLICAGVGVMNRPTNSKKNYRGTEG